ncbi:MAG: SDR family oxidoreductase [Bacteroidota bacterium]
MKLLFIGGNGNISSSCSRLALEQGHEVYVLTRGQSKDDLPEGIHRLTGDINDLDQMRKVLKNMTFDAVANFIAFHPDDIERDIHLFEQKTDQYVFISSASCYQKPLLHARVTESTPLKNPHWQYSRDKIACEDLLVKAYREEDFPMTIIRPSLTYDTVIPVPIAGWKEYTVVDRIKKGLPVISHGEGTTLWTITHASDFAVGFVGLLGHQQAIGHPFHITSDELLSWDQIYQAVAAAVGTKAEIVHIPSAYLAARDDHLQGSLVGDKAVSAVFDNSKIRTFVPEYNPTITFKKGIERTIRWFESDVDRMVVSAASNEWVDGTIAAYRKAVAS